MKYLLRAIEDKKAGCWDLVFYNDETNEITYRTIWKKQLKDEVKDD